MKSIKPIFIIFMLFAALTMSAQTHNITRGGTKQNKQQTTTTKKATTPASKKAGSATQRRSSATTSHNSKQQLHSSRITFNPVIQNLINNMVYVSGGTFTMGATSEQGSDAFSNEKPTHQVTLPSFSIGRYEVTQEEWEAVMGSNPSEFKGARRPVENVSWNDCQEFIRKLNTITGKNFRLPTEAEWEFAARGGNKSRSYKYSGSNNFNDVSWCMENSGDKPLEILDYSKIDSNHCQTHDVGSKKSNELGLYDMSGNVMEWGYDL